MQAERHPHPDPTLARLAAKQHGVVAPWQLQALGVTGSAARQRAAVGRLHRIHRGVYAVGHPRVTRKRRWMAAVLAYGEDAVLSHRTALALHGLRPVPSAAVDVTVPGCGRRNRPGIRVHRTMQLDPRDRTTRDGIPVTTVARTMLDYADVARPQQLRLALEAAERQDALNGYDLTDLLARSPGRHGAKTIRDVLAQMRGPAPWTQSELVRLTDARIQNGARSVVSELRTLIAHRQNLL